MIFFISSGHSICEDNELLKEKDQFDKGPLVVKLGFANQESFELNLNKEIYKNTVLLTELQQEHPEKLDRIGRVFKIQNFNVDKAYLKNVISYSNYPLILESMKTNTINVNMLIL